MPPLASAKHAITRTPLVPPGEKGSQGPPADTSPLCRSPPPCQLPSTGWHPSVSSKGPLLGPLSVPVSKKIAKDVRQASCFPAYVTFRPYEKSPDKNMHSAQEVLTCEKTFLLACSHRGSTNSKHFAPTDGA